VFEASSAEEGGGVILDPAPDDKSLTVYLDDSQSMVKRANRSKPVSLELGATLHAAGFDPAEMVALAADPQVKDILRHNTDDAIRRGVFGAPTMFVGDQMFFGQDRLDFVREALR